MGFDLWLQRVIAHEPASMGVSVGKIDRVSRKPTAKAFPT